jgi:hypothetical protein
VVNYRLKRHKSSRTRISNFQNFSRVISGTRVRKERDPEKAEEEEGRAGKEREGKGG